MHIYRRSFIFRLRNGGPIDGDVSSTVRLFQFNHMYTSGFLWCALFALMIGFRRVAQRVHGINKVLSKLNHSILTNKHVPGSDVDFTFESQSRQLIAAERSSLFCPSDAMLTTT